MKNLNSYFFSNRFFSLCLVFFVSFSIVFYSFVPKRVVNADTFVSPVQRDINSIIMTVLGGLSVVVSVNDAHDFLKQEQEYANKLALENASKDSFLVRCSKQGYVCSKEFINDIISKWLSLIHI